MFPFGSIVLIRFPFTDLTGDKRRPALVVSSASMSRDDMVVCFITSMPQSGPCVVALGPGQGTGLKIPSWVCFGKLATLHRRVIAGRLGGVTPAWLLAHQASFFSVFGFGP